MPPETVEEFFQKMHFTMASMPKRLRQCAHYVTNNPEKIAISTVVELSEGAGVPPSAFVRFCQELGFSGFSQMRRVFRDSIESNWPDYPTRLKGLRENGPSSSTAMLAEFIEAGRTSLERLSKTISEQDLDKSSFLLSQADTIHVVGYRRAFPVASYIMYVFEKMGIPAILHSGVGKLESSYMLRKNDALLAITFAPYRPETIQLSEKAMELGLDVIAITDTNTQSLFGERANHLVVDEYDVGAFRGLSATLSVAVTLAVLIGTRRDSQARPKIPVAIS